MFNRIRGFFSSLFGPSKSKRLSRATVLSRDQLPSAIAYEDEVNTFSSLQTFDEGTQHTSFTPTVDGQIGWDGATFLFREGGTNKTIGSGGGITGTLTSPRVVIASGASSVTDDANFTFDTSTDILSLGASSKTRISHTAGTLGDGEKAHTLTATLDTTAATQIGSRASITTANGSNSNRYAFLVDLLAGYTGTGAAVTTLLQNDVAGTGTAISFSDTTVVGNIAGQFLTNGNTTGIKVGVRADAAGSGTGTCIGTHSLASSSSSGNCVGVVGNASAGTNKVGGYFGLFTAVPSFDSAALVADNGSVASPIFRGRDNGTDVFDIADGGLIVHTPGTITTGANAHDLTCTFPSSSSSETMVEWNLTTAGSGVVGKRGLQVNLIAGYTAAGAAIGLDIANAVAGTGNDLKLASAGSTALGNIASRLESSASTAGANIGIVAEARAATGKNVGGAFKAISGAATSNVGIIGAATGATNNVGVAAFLAPADNPTFTSTALLVDNVGVAAPIAVFRDNGTAKFTIEDGGRFTHATGTLGDAERAYLLTATLNSGSGSQQGVVYSVTSAGSGSNSNQTMVLRLNAGYTGSGLANTLRVYSEVDGTGTSIYGINSSVNVSLECSNEGAGTSGHNIAGRFTSLSTGNGHAIGIVAEASGSDADLFNIGVIGRASHTHTAAKTVAGYFLTDSISDPILEDSALFLDSGDSGYPVEAVRGGGEIGSRRYVLHVTTTNTATPTELVLDSNDTLFLPALADGDTWGYKVWITARGTAGTNDNKSAFYELSFLIQRTGATTALVNSALEIIGEEISGWDLTAAADDTNERPAVKVTGDAASTIKWVGYAIGTKVS